jgi:hypothetical protein
MKVGVRKFLGVSAAASMLVLAAAGPADASRRQCIKHKPRGAIKFRDNGQAILFEGANGKRYGCAFAKGKVRVLPGQAHESNATNTLQRDHFEFQRWWVAYASIYRGPGATEMRVYAFNLKNGKTRPADPERARGTTIYEGQNDAVLDAIRLKDNGSVAWIWSYHDADNPANDYSAVAKMDATTKVSTRYRRVNLFDDMGQESRYDADTLRLDGGTTIRWKDRNGLEDRHSGIPIE